jgi:glutathione peroxidase
MNNIYDYEFQLANGNSQPMSEFRGKVLLIVNTASKCGFTPQFEGLEKLQEKYADRGLVVIGFPCNQFAHQDPGSNEEIVEFCQLNYGVTFPMAEKIEVNGSGAHPLYQFLKSEAAGLLGSEKIKWNFTKFLVDAEGKVLERFAPSTKPEKIASAIEPLLA